MTSYLTKEFLDECARMREAGTLNMYVDEAVTNKVTDAELERELKLAIKMHGKYMKQPGSSPLHCAVQAACWTLLGMLNKSRIPK